MAQRDDELILGKALLRSREVPAQTSVDVFRGLTLRRTSGGVLVTRLHYSANPDRNPELHPEWKQSERKLYTSQASWDREQQIIDEAGGGELVFADTLITHWDRIVITDPGWRPRPQWDCYAGLDYGKTNPTVLLRAPMSTPMESSTSVGNTTCPDSRCGSMPPP
jgi:hypothetical protein